VLFPFSPAAPLRDEVATVLVDLVIGIATGTLVNGVALRSVRMVRPAAGRAAPAAADGRPGSTHGV
jgi:hypothetical protein